MRYVYGYDVARFVSILLLAEESARYLVASREAEEPFVLALSRSRGAARFRLSFFFVSRSARLLAPVFLPRRPVGDR